MPNGKFQVNNLIIFVLTTVLCFKTYGLWLKFVIYGPLWCRKSLSRHEVTLVGLQYICYQNEGSK